MEASSAGATAAPDTRGQNGRGTFLTVPHTIVLLCVTSTLVPGRNGSGVGSVWFHRSPQTNPPS